MPDQGGNSEPAKTILHASCVALQGNGLLILGASGQGKSGLALNLMAMGAALIADDRVVLTRKDSCIVASAPTEIAGLIEARGIGLLHATASAPVPVMSVVDLDQVEPQRMPPRRQMDVLGVGLDLLFRVDAPHFAAALIQLLKKGRRPES